MFTPDVLTFFSRKHLQASSPQVPLEDMEIICSFCWLGDKESAESLNNAGQVVGQAGGYGAYLWSHEQGAQALPGVDGAGSEIGYDIYNLGQLVGVGRNPGGELRTVRWDGPKTITDLASLPGWYLSGIEGGGLTKINDTGLIIGTVWIKDKGWSGAIFSGNGWILLSTLVPLPIPNMAVTYLWLPITRLR